jgi:Tol biopolymer transport system component
MLIIRDRSSQIGRLGPIAVVAVGLSFLAAFPPATHATFPGKNGVIAFVMQRDECLHPEADECISGEPQLFTVRADGSERTRLTMGFGPTFSHDGRWLALDRCHCSDFLEAGSTVYTWRFGARTPPSRLLERGGQTANLHPAWSPDGSRLAFARARDPVDRLTAFPSTIYSASSDGSDVRRLASGYSPDWSSTDQIAFVRYGRRGFDVYVMRSDGSRVRRVGRGSAPSWSPHGRLLAFERGGIGPNGIYIARPDGSRLRRLTTRNDSEPAWSPNGRSIAFVRASPDGTTFRLMTVPSDGGRAKVIVRSRYLQLIDAPSWRPLSPTGPP